MSKAVYASVQSPLYRHTTISSYEKLQLFVGTLHSAATFDTWGEGISKNIVSLCISVDPNAGTRPTAVILSRMISVIGRYTPHPTFKTNIGLQPSTILRKHAFDFSTRYMYLRS